MPGPDQPRRGQGARPPPFPDQPGDQEERDGPLRQRDGLVVVDVHPRSVHHVDGKRVWKQPALAQGGEIIGVVEDQGIAAPEGDPEQTARQPLAETAPLAAVGQTEGQAGEHGHPARNPAQPGGEHPVDDRLGGIGEHDIRLFPVTDPDQGPERARSPMGLVPVRWMGIGWCSMPSCRSRPTTSWPVMPWWGPPWPPRSTRCCLAAPGFPAGASGSGPGSRRARR